MTGEEMERAIEFLLQSQANFEARLDRSQAEFEARLERLETGLEQTNQQVAETGRQLQAYAETQSEFIQIVTTAMQGLAASQSRTDERLAETQSRTDERLAEIQSRTDERFARTNEHLMQTDERLNKLADLVERIITEGRNGHA